LSLIPPKCSGGSLLDSPPIMDNKEDVYTSIKILKNPHNMIISYSVPYVYGSATKSKYSKKLCFP
jgi:hypothetical protein